MPLATIHLISLANEQALPSLLKHIRSSKATPLVLSKPIRWIIRPEHIEANTLLSPQWHLLLILEDTQPSQDLISSITSSSAPFQIAHHWSTKAGIPSRLTKDFLTTTNPSLLHPPSTSTIPPLTNSLSKPLLKPSSQDLSLSPDLNAWISTDPLPGAVSMLNLLSFRPGLKPSYLKYGQAFADSIGTKRGGNAKLVGNIVRDSTAGAEAEKVWHEFALAHYPSLLHFADMLASQDYQEVNQKYRVPALADTCILCTSELEIERLREGERAKL